MKWLRRNWFRILIAMWIIGGAITIIFCLDALINNKQYRENIKILDTDIKRLEDVNKAIRGINDDLRIVRAEDKAASDKKIADMEENQKRELARIGSERDVWKAKVKDMPPSVVVIEIRTALKTDEVWERPDGILFSLVAARDCLAILGDFSIAEERDQWREDYFKAMDVIEDKDEIIATGDEIIIGIDDINFNLEEIIKDKDEQFNLSEKRNRQSWWRGIKQGVPIGGGIVAFLWLVLGK